MSTLNIKIIAAVVFGVIVLLQPDFTMAQNLASQAQCTGTDCSACNLMYLANAIIKWLIGFLFVLFGVLIAVAGWGLVISGGNISARDAAKDKFTNAIIGFIIILAAWLVVDTIMRGLVGTDGIIKGNTSGNLFWAEIECQSQREAVECKRGCKEALTIGNIETFIEPSEVVIFRTSDGGVSSSFTPGTGAGGLTGADAQSRLAAGGILDGGRVISYEGLHPHVIDSIIEMNNACNCNITVTEATGGKHAGGTYSHANGYKLDLRTRDNPALSEYVRQNFELTGRTKKANEPIYQRQTNTGAEKCLFHSTHLDCQFVPGG